MSYKKRSTRGVDREAPPKRMNSFLQGLLASYGLDRQIARYQFVTRWAEIMGDEIAQRTRPECIRGNCLIVRVSDSVWAQEISFRRIEILNRLKRTVPELDQIGDLRVYVAPL